MVRHTDAADDESTTTTEATIYHTRFVDEDDDAFDVTRDLRMGYDFAVDHDADPNDRDVVDAAYVKAGTVTVDVPESKHPAPTAYGAWEDGDGHDPGSTRSMATGDVIIVDRAGDDAAYFVDSIGFEEINAVPFDRVFGGHAEDGDDDDFDDDRFVDEDEADRIIAEARDALGDDHVNDALIDADTKGDAAASLAGDVVDAEDDGAHGDAWDMTPTDAEVAAAFGVDDVDDITDEMLADVDTPEPPERVDVSGYKSAAGAAKKTHEALTEWADFLFDAGDAVVLYDPDETAAKRDVGDDVRAWCVAWEGGPNEWATALTGGTTLTGFEGPRMTYDGEPEVAGLTSGEGFDVECFYSFDLLFFDA